MDVIIALLVLGGFIFIIGGIAARLLKRPAPTRRKRATGRSQRPHPSPHAYALERNRFEGGEGLVVVRTEDGQRLSWRTLLRGDGLESINVVGEKYHMDDLQDDSFGVGRLLRLEREPDNKYDSNAIAVLNANGALQAGYIPREDAGRLAKKLDRGEPWECYSMWEVHEKGKRVSLRLLLLHEDADVDRSLLAAPRAAAPVRSS